jgi:anti-sigma-K factor RskA
VIDGVGVASAGANSTYQVWLVDVGGARSVGLFEPEPDGRVSVAFAGVDPAGFTLGITVEPDGGSETPTDPIVATAS